MSVHNRCTLYLMILQFDCVKPWKKCSICRCFWISIIGYRNINKWSVFPLYISFNGRSIASFQRGGGGAVRSIYAVNVVIPMIIFFCSFHNDTSVVWISKTVSIDATYLQQLIRNIPYSFWWRQRDLYKIFRGRSTFS